VGTVALERRDGVAILRLSKGRGNAIDGPLVDDLAEAAREMARDDGVRGVLLASAHPRLFCPGLDLVALSALDRPGLEDFLRRFLAVVRDLFAFPKPVVAAVSGHAVAGGCILALTADWRVLARGATIGLNEVKIGLPLPRPVALLVAASVAPPVLSKVALLGRNFADDEAVESGLVDELAEPARVVEAGLQRLAEFAEKEPQALALTKASLRSGALAQMDAAGREHVGAFLDAWFSPGAQERIRGILEGLRRSSP
jgi:enoyl-CoA hydratase/carnithine racemase